VPWCDECAKFWSPATLREGACPTCGAPLARQAQSVRPGGQDQPSAPPGHPSGDGADDEHVKAPWHFKLLLVGLVVYLGYRAWQGVDWLAHWLPKHL